MKSRRLLASLFSFISINMLITATFAANHSPFTAEDLVSLERISEATLSPDGKHIAYVLRKTDLKANKGRTDIWLTRISDNKTQQLTTHHSSDHSPLWFDDKTVYFISNRSKKSQVWKINTKTHNVEQVSHFPVNVTSFKISSNKQAMVFSANVHPDCDDLACTQSRDKKTKSGKATGVIYNKMFVRHWDHWIGKKQSQLFLVQLNKQAQLKNKNVTAISKSVNANVPSDPFGSNAEYEISANGEVVYFSARLQNAVEPTSTNFDIYRISVNNTSRAINLTKNNKAWDTQPVLSHDGHKLAYLAMRRPGFEADRFEVIIKDLRTGITKRITEHGDRSFDSLQFSHDDKSLYLTGAHLGKGAAWKFDIAKKSRQLLNSNGTVSQLNVGKNKIVYAKDSLKSPVQLYTASVAGKNQKQLTFNNKKKLESIAFGNYEQFNFKGWNNQKVYGYIVKPANYVEGKKYPLAFLIHGGPQGSFGDHFHYRWNPQTYAGQGFVSVMIDFHGSTGYGQRFTDSISENWGSKPFIDLQKGLKYVTKTFSYIDANNVCALGASYGGYMINWIAGNWPDRFKCLVNHDGIFDNRMMYYATEELWFVEKEHGGPYYKSPSKHEKFNPVNYVNNWKTPMLVVQGELDYRIPVTQSLATFTALQRKGIKSKLLYYADENHWVLSPANSIQWHNEVNKWLHEFISRQ